MKGRIFKFESFATHDGPGIRGAVFLSGCPLRCAYCHNPDSWSGGEEVDSRVLAKRIASYRAYYRKGGGATVSGGEPLLQSAFTLDLMRALHEEGLSVALDTAGSLIDENTDAIVREADLILLDLKFSTEADYRRYTGGSLAATLAFLDRCRGKRIWIRTVVLPGINDTESAIDRYLELIEGIPVERYELLPFHTLGFAKYEALGLENPLAALPAADAETVKLLQRYADRKRSECREGE